MIISRSKKFVFVHLEKCGGTSIESALEPHLGWDDIILGGTKFGDSIQEAYFERFGFNKVKKEYLWKHSTAKNAYKYIGAQRWPDYSVFSVVREPISLLQSLYCFSSKSVDLHLAGINEFKWRDMFEKRSFPDIWPFREPYIQAYVASKINHSGFNGFVNTVLTNNYDAVRPQIDRLSIKKDHIGKLTTKRSVGDIGMVVDISQIDERWKEICKYLGFHHKEIKLERLNATNSQNQDLDLSDANKKRVYKHFAGDYRLLPKYTGVEW